MNVGHYDDNYAVTEKQEEERYQSRLRATREKLRAAITQQGIETVLAEFILDFDRARSYYVY